MPLGRFALGGGGECVGLLLVSTAAMFAGWSNFRGWCVVVVVGVIGVGHSGGRETGWLGR